MLHVLFRRSAYPQIHPGDPWQGVSRSPWRAPGTGPGAALIPWHGSLRARLGERAAALYPFELSTVDPALARLAARLAGTC